MREPGPPSGVGKRVGKEIRNSELIHLAGKRAICGSAVFLTDIFQLEWRLGFVPYFWVSGSCCCA
jgi:hypothetical protein